MNTPLKACSAGPGAGRLQSSPEMATKSGQRRAPRPPARPRNRRAASAHVGRRPAWLCWQAQRAATSGRAGQGWPEGGGRALSRVATEPNRRARNGHPGFRLGGNATAFLNAFWTNCCVYRRQSHSASTGVLAMESLSDTEDHALCLHGLPDHGADQS